MNKITPNILYEAETRLEQTLRLNFNENANHSRMTRIGATIGTASRKLNVLIGMIEAGMTMVRINCSQETIEEHKKSIELIGKAIDTLQTTLNQNVHCSIALDLQGPEIRTGWFETKLGDRVTLEKGEIIKLSINKNYRMRGNRYVVYVDYFNIINFLEIGKRVFLDDGAIMLVVIEVSVDCLICQIEKGGVLGVRKKVVLPGVETDLLDITDNDRKFIDFAVDNKVDFLIASGVESASTIAVMRELIGKESYTQILTKLETSNSLKHMEEIIHASDAIILARSDLAIDIPNANVFIIQKAIIENCNRRGKPLICATNILESMLHSTTPTQAEVADLTNMVIDGADMIMLSSETAIGTDPANVISIAAKVIREAEMAVFYAKLQSFVLKRNLASINGQYGIAIAAMETARTVCATAIILLTRTGATANAISLYRPRCPIFAVTRCRHAFQRMMMRRGIFPLLYTKQLQPDWSQDVTDRVQYALTEGKRMETITSGDAVIILTPGKENSTTTNSLNIVYVDFCKENQT